MFACRVPLTFYSTRVPTFTSPKQYINLWDRINRLQVKRALRIGEALSDELTVAVLSLLLNHHICASKGYHYLFQTNNNSWVLDDYPQTQEQAKLMIEQGFVPTHVIELDAPLADLVRRGQDQCNNDALFDLFHMAHHPAIEMRDAHYRRSIVSLKSFYESKYGPVWWRIDARGSRWSIGRRIVLKVRENLAHRQRYQWFTSRGTLIVLLCVTVDLAMAAFQCGVPDAMFHEKLGKFSNYCPVSWIDRRELVQRNNYAFIAEYRVRINSSSLILGRVLLDGR
jgi:adenylate kinase family enzyme